MTPSRRISTIIIQRVLVTNPGLSIGLRGKSRGYSGLCFLSRLVIIYPLRLSLAGSVSPWPPPKTPAARDIRNVTAFIIKEEKI